jgi:hypothetical protein
MFKEVRKAYIRHAREKLFLKSRRKTSEINHQQDIGKIKEGNLLK